MTNEEANAIERARVARPFAFEDLPLNDEGKRIEPEKWGPKYSKPPKPSPAKPRGLDPWPSNCASGQKYDFDAAKHRAKLKAEFAAGAASERLAWATGKLSVDRPGMHGDIHHAYAQAMDAKAARLANERANADRAPQRDAFRPAKPHYVLRDGAWRLAA